MPECTYRRMVLNNMKAVVIATACGVCRPSEKLSSNSKSVRPRPTTKLIPKNIAVISSPALSPDQKDKAGCITSHSPYATGRHKKCPNSHSKLGEAEAPFR